MAEWLFETPGRLVWTLVVVLSVIVVGVGWATLGDDAAINRGGSADTMADQPTTSASVTVDDRTNVSRTATAYLHAFFTHSGSTTEWHKAIDRYSTAALADSNATVPRTVVPVAALRTLTITGIKGSYAELRAEMSGGLTLRVAIVLDSDEWLVDEVAPVAAGTAS